MRCSRRRYELVCRHPSTELPPSSMVWFADNVSFAVFDKETSLGDLLTCGGGGKKTGSCQVQWQVLLSCIYACQFSSHLVKEVVFVKLNKSCRRHWRGIFEHEMPG